MNCEKCGNKLEILTTTPHNGVHVEDMDYWCNSCYCWAIDSLEPRNQEEGMVSKYWKNVEREVADRLGGFRLGATGKDDADVHTDTHVIQVKYRKVLPQWLQGACDNAAVNASRHGLLPAVILKLSGAQWNKAIVMIPLEDFERLIKTTREKSS